jgi:hypothetical protein
MSWFSKKKKYRFFRAMYLGQANPKTPDKLTCFFVIGQFEIPTPSINNYVKVKFIAGGAGMDVENMGKFITITEHVGHCFYNIQYYETADELAKDHLGEII